MKIVKGPSGAQRRKGGWSCFSCSLVWLLVVVIVVMGVAVWFVRLSRIQSAERAMTRPTGSSVAISQMIESLENILSDTATLKTGETSPSNTAEKSHVKPTPFSNIGRPQQVTNAPKLVSESVPGVISPGVVDSSKKQQSTVRQEAAVKVSTRPSSWKEFAAGQLTKSGKHVTPPDVSGLFQCPSNIVEALRKPKLSDEDIKWCQWALSPTGGGVKVCRLRIVEKHALLAVTHYLVL
jgi:cytoskeletal protein RodZ